MKNPIEIINFDRILILCKRPITRYLPFSSLFRKHPIYLVIGRLL
ncbi:hypothetical protein HMPREF1883_00774 [Streptococcus agalactiae]|nr:hypothetical protein HMPREF1883_00774 [Streptococcus agalactiae]